jgi:hypothetical protein
MPLFESSPEAAKNMLSERTTNYLVQHLLLLCGHNLEEEEGAFCMRKFGLAAGQVIKVASKQAGAYTYASLFKESSSRG